VDILNTKSLVFHKFTFLTDIKLIKGYGISMLFPLEYEALSINSSLLCIISIFNAAT